MCVASVGVIEGNAKWQPWSSRVGGGKSRVEEETGRPGGRKEREEVKCVLEVSVIITLMLYGVYLGVVIGKGRVRWVSF